LENEEENKKKGGNKELTNLGKPLMQSFTKKKNMER
jgi:hypothetical protein